MKINVYEAEKWEEEAFSGIAANHEIRFYHDPLQADGAGKKEDCQILSTFIYSDLGGETLEKFPRLKLITTRSTGFDHIDLPYCKERGITVCNVPTYGENTVAEHVFALLLNISHRLCEASDRTRKGDFSSKGLQGFDIRGKTLGVIGTGNIGRWVIQIAKGFEMKVLAFDVKPNGELEDRLSFQYKAMKEVLSRSDIITLHVPANKKTHHLLSTDEFAIMKEGAVLINTARGSIVDVLAMARALAEGKLAAAGLDVLPEEPLVQEEAELLRSFYEKKYDLERLLSGHILLGLRNVIITPHNAFNTREAVQRILDTTAENMEAFIRGNPQNMVAGAQS